MAQFSNKVALVVGGTLGIGQATALLLAQQGAQVVVAGRDPDHGRQTVDYIEGCGGRAVYHPVDLLKPTTIEALIRYTVETFGQLDYLVQSAGLEGSVAPTVDCTEDNWYSVINTNITGTWYCMKYAIPEMLKNGGGAIVNVASVIGVIAFPGLPAYTASKAGVIGLTKTAALEYAKQNIRINVVCPGSVRTPMYMRFSGGTPEAEAYMSTFHPIGRIGEPNEVASAITYLLSDGASFVTGHVMPVAGGWEVP